MWVEPGFGSWGLGLSYPIHTDLHQGGPEDTASCLFTHSQDDSGAPELASLNGSSSSPISRKVLEQAKPVVTEVDLQAGVLGLGALD